MTSKTAGQFQTLPSGELRGFLGARRALLERHRGKPYLVCSQGC